MTKYSQRALLVNIDSTIPNLALMKISSWVKCNGGTASFTESDPTHAYISCIFRKNKKKADSSAMMLKMQYPDIVIDIGGSGYDLDKSIPEIDLAVPDYSIYPDMNYSLGFTSRGCIRKCPFCIVPQKEGSFRKVQHPVWFHNPDFKEIVLMDNNILADKDWFFGVTDWILEEGLKVDFNQGLDIRLIDENVAKRIHELKQITSWKFAFDSMDYKDAVLKGIRILQNAKVDSRRNILFYVYLDGDNDFEDALDRCNILRDNGVSSFLMINQESKRTQRMTDLKCWCRPWCYWATPFDGYKRSGAACITERVN